MKPSPRIELIALYNTLIKLWNSQDAKAMASLYAASGAQVGFDGSRISGPKSIEEHLTPIFLDHPTQKFVCKILNVKKLSEDVGMIQAIAGMVPRNGTRIDPSKNTIQTMVARKIRGKWKVELFQNTPARLDGRQNAVKDMTKDLQSLTVKQLATSKLDTTS